MAGNVFENPAYKLIMKGTGGDKPAPAAAQPGGIVPKVVDVSASFNRSILAPRWRESLAGETDLEPR